MNRPDRTARSRRMAAVPVALILGAGLILGACGDDDDTDTDTTTSDASSASVTSEVAAGEELTTAAVWARSSPAVASAGAVYLEITNPTDVDDALTDVSVDASVAATAEIHETTMAPAEGEGDMSTTTGMGGEGDMTTTTAMGGEGDMTTTTAMGGEGDMTTTTATDGSGGMMTMKEVEEIPVPAGETVVLEPGGYHIMLLELAEPLEAGDTFEVTLTFAEAGEVVVEAEVRDTAP